MPGVDDGGKAMWTLVWDSSLCPSLSLHRLCLPCSLRLDGLRRRRIWSAALVCTNMGGGVGGDVVAQERRYGKITRLVLLRRPSAYLQTLLWLVRSPSTLALVRCLSIVVVQPPSEAADASHLPVRLARAI